MTSVGSARTWHFPRQDGTNIAEPAHTGNAILALTDMDEPPLRLILGEHAMPLVIDTYNERIASWQQHQPLAASTQ